MLATLRSCAPALARRVSRLGGWTGAFFPSMLTDSRFVDQEFPILIQREVLELRPQKRHDLSYATTRKGRERGKFPTLFPVNGDLPARRPVRQDCVRHQEVRASWDDFLRHRIAQHARSNVLASWTGSSRCRRQARGVRPLKNCQARRETSGAFGPR
jgi:hypothetical protein